MEQSRKERFMEQAVSYYVVQASRPDWDALTRELVNVGYTNNEVDEILRDCINSNPGIQQKSI